MLGVERVSNKAVADLGGEMDALPLGPIFFHFHAVFSKNYAK